jgi:hypothetical protein
MPVTTRQQLRNQEKDTDKNDTIKNQPKKNEPKQNHANIDFKDASKEWRKNKIKHDNCCFTYVDSYE